MFLPNSDPKKLAALVYQAIIEPALLLADKLHLSVDRFSILRTQFSALRPEERSKIPKHYGSCECIDILQSGKILKPQAIAAAESITYMFDLYPLLGFEAVKVDAYAKLKVLSKFRILVAARNKGDGPSALQIESGEPTLVALLLEENERNNAGSRR